MPLYRLGPDNIYMYTGTRQLQFRPLEKWRCFYSIWLERRISTAGIAIAECQPTRGSLVVLQIARQRAEVRRICRYQLLHEGAVKPPRRQSRIRTASCFIKTQSVTPTTHAVQPQPSGASSDTDISGRLQPRGCAGYHKAGSRTSDR